MRIARLILAAAFALCAVASTAEAQMTREQYDAVQRNIRKQQQNANLFLCDHYHDIRFPKFFPPYCQRDLKLEAEYCQRTHSQICVMPQAERHDMWYTRRVDCYRNNVKIHWGTCSSAVYSDDDEAQYDDDD